MGSTSPRLWQYSQTNSPLPLPEGAMLFSNRELIPLTAPKMPESETLDLEGLKQWIGAHKTEKGESLGDVLDLSNKRPLLLAGELANPYRLADIMAPDLPLIPIRLEGLCRTWSDSLDSREVQPGVHHVTIASSPGWWETSHLTLIGIQEMKALVKWLDGTIPGAWRPIRSAEGVIRLENDAQIGYPSAGQMSWDGIEERVEVEMPAANGPALDLSTIIIPIHTKYGCYDSRGKIIRCAHMPQRTFHDEMFRRGSSKKWNTLIKTL
jgi:hypothetical protein